MRLDGRWRYDWLTLYLFSKQPGDLQWTGTETIIVNAPEEDLSSLPWNSSATRNCDPGWDQGGEAPSDWVPTWQLDLRVPLAPDAPLPGVTVAHGTVVQHEEGDALGLWVTGGPCSGPAPVVTLAPRGVDAPAPTP